jgi:hypothetical protein
MQIYVGKNGQQLGPFSLEEINRKLADGTFAGTDLAWYEGAAGWAPLSGVPGVVLPAAAPAVAPVSAAPSAPTPPAPAAAPVTTPVRSNVPIVPQAAPPKGSYRTLSLVSWILLGLTFFISFIPFLGCGSWILAWPVAVAAIIMGIIIVVRGGALQGILVILAGVLIVPLSLLGQFASLAVFGGTVDRQQQNQVLENLRTIDGAKTQFVAQTKATDGATVTMASLTSYFSGKEIKPAVGEQYDPRPVGQPPIATIPEGKSLGKFKAGDVVTAASLEQSLASSSALTWVFNQTTSPAPTVAPAISPKATTTASPSPTISPRPSPPSSVAPRPTASPRLLISPRQNVEPNEPPSSSVRPSPRDGPRTAPRETPSEPEESSGLRQGRQFPRDSPAPSPEDEEDE